MNNSSSEVILIDIKPSDYEKKIYRIIPIERLFQLFETNKNTLVLPSLWEDPWEDLYTKDLMIDVQSGSIQSTDQVPYCQCWTYRKASMAMWKLYAPNHTGVRVRTTIGKLIATLPTQNTNSKVLVNCVAKVEYKNERAFNKYRENIHDLSNNKLEIRLREQLKAYAVKRKAFSYEAELRVMSLLGDPDDVYSQNKTFEYQLNPLALIDQIRLHPSLDNSLYQSMSRAISKATGFPIEKIKCSSLLDVPQQRVFFAN